MGFSLLICLAILIPPLFTPYTKVFIALEDAKEASCKLFTIIRIVHIQMVAIADADNSSIGDMLISKDEFWNNRKVSKATRVPTSME